MLSNIKVRVVNYGRELLWMAEFLSGTNFRGRPNPRNLVPTKKQFSVSIMKENAITTNFDPHECVIFAKSTKIGTHENKVIHSMNNSASTFTVQPGYVNSMLTLYSNFTFCRT